MTSTELSNAVPQTSQCLFAGLLPDLRLPVEECAKNNVDISSAPRVIVGTEAFFGGPSKGDPQKMARRRYQDPKPKKEGNWWYILYYEDQLIDGRRKRKKKREKLGPASLSSKDAKRLAAEKLRPQNQGLISVGAIVPFVEYVNVIYAPIEMPLLASSTQNRYQSVIKNYLIPAFGTLPLRDLTPVTVQRFFSELNPARLSYESRDKVRDVLASIMTSAVKYQYLITNPTEGVKLPPAKRGSRVKPYITPEQFDALIERIPEPYATMVYVAIFTGLRISELVGLRWGKVNADSITVDERYCRGDWGCPKSSASNATIAVNQSVINRIHRLKTLTVTLRAGRAKRTFKAVGTDGPQDLVFQSPMKRAPMRDNNVLVRHVKPAARELGIPWVNWQVLRRSHATWLKLVGADVKDAQHQMRHSRATTTLDVYQQFVPESQRRAVDRLSDLVTNGLVN